MSGLIEMNTALIRSLGVEPSFYVACALTYLEFLSEREVSSISVSYVLKPGLRMFNT